MSLFANPNPKGSGSGGGGGTPAPANASSVSFNNSSTNIASSNVQGAVEELDTKNSIQDSEIEELQSSQYKLKANSSDTSPDYLINKIDSDTLQIIADKLVAKTLDGLTVTIGELNHLSGATDNIPDQIRALVGGMKFKGEVATETELSVIDSPKQGDTYVVANDSTHSGAQTLYVHDGVEFVYVAPFDYVPDATLNTKGAIQLSGDLGNPLSTASNPQLTETGVVAGSYDVASVTVDNKGRVSNISSAIDDGSPSTDKVYSSSKIKSELDSKADNIHNHNLSNLEDVDTSERETGKVLMWDEDLGKHVYTVVEIDTSIGGGQEFEGTIPWNNVTGQPQAYPPTEHNHNDLYYTKDEAEGHVNFVRDLMEQEQGKVSTYAGDEPDYLQRKVDNATLTIEGNELKVKSVDGLTIGIVDLNNWLSGTSGNLQSQINDIGDSLTSLTSGMNFLGKAESYSEMQSITTMVNGSVVVVLKDESRNDGRSLYVYSTNFDAWDFIGEFIFSDEFIKLKDTPASYSDADGKYVRVDETNKKLIFDDIDYSDLQNKPQSTITQIDDAVDKKHEHINKSMLDRIGIDEQGQITIDGVPYVPANAVLPKKEYLYALIKSTTSYPVSQGARIMWDSSTGNIPYNPSNGLFTLKAGKHYRVQVNLAGATGSTQFFRIAMWDSNNNEIGGRALYSKYSTNIGVGPLVVHVIPDVTKDYKIVFVQEFGDVPYLYNESCSMDIIEL